MTAPRESAVVRAITRWLQTLGPGVVWRNIAGTPYGVVGDPDFMISVGGHFVCLEAKRSGWHATPAWRETAQARRLHKWQESGATVAVVTSLDEARAVIEPILVELAQAYAATLAANGGLAVESGLGAGGDVVGQVVDAW